MERVFVEFFNSKPERAHFLTIKIYERLLSFVRFNKLQLKNVSTNFRLVFIPISSTLTRFIIK
jgi:hypothetical protein